MSGKIIEVINIDAEGRLILADALTYARRQGCTHLVDAATLTGAITVALGHLNVGLFASDAGLRDRVLAAAKTEGERMWPMPLDEEYKDTPRVHLDIAGTAWNHEAKPYTAKGPSGVPGRTLVRLAMDWQ